MKMFIVMAPSEPEGYSSGRVERLVDCVIGAAILEATGIMCKAIEDKAEEPE
jgi:hypothetical protein